MMSIRITKEQLKKSMEEAENIASMTKEEKAKLEETTKKFIALSPEEREELRKRVDAEEPFV